MPTKLKDQETGKVLPWQHLLQKLQTKQLEFIKDFT